MLNGSDQQLRLPISVATLELNNTMYTCEVQVLLATGNVTSCEESIVFVISGKQ